MDCVELTFRVTKPRASLPALKVQIVGFPGQRRGSTREAAQCTSFVGESEGRGSIRTRNSTVLAGGLLFTAARWIGLSSSPPSLLSYSSSFSSPSNRWVCRWSWKKEFVSRVQIQVICHPLCRGDIPPRRRMDGRMDGAGYQECSRRLFCGPSSESSFARRSRLEEPTLHFHFVAEIRVPSLILTFPMTLEALRRKGHRRSPPFDSPPRSAVPWPCIHMHLTIFRRKVCLTAVCIQ